MLKEFIAQKEWVVGPEPSLSIVTDVIEFATRETPAFYPVSVSGYHIREAGSTAAQELAFTLADGFAYLEDALGALRAAIRAGENTVPAVIDAVKRYATMGEIMAVYGDEHGGYRESLEL